MLKKLSIICLLKFDIINIQLIILSLNLFKEIRINQKKNLKI